MPTYLIQPAGRPREVGVVIRVQTGNLKPLVTAAIKSNGATTARALALHAASVPHGWHHTWAL